MDKKRSQLAIRLVQIALDYQTILSDYLTIASPRQYSISLFVIVSGCVNLDESVLNRCFNRKTTFLATQTAINWTTDKFQKYLTVPRGLI